MADVFSKSERSRIMRSVRSMGTGAENTCEDLLRALKLRFRKQPLHMPGRPDFLLTSCRLVLFVHGCFWHAHAHCKSSALPSSNLDYWTRKIGANRRRDRRVRDALRRDGWRTAVIWECKLRNRELIARRLLRLVKEGRHRKKLR